MDKAYQVLVLRALKTIITLLVSLYIGTLGPAGIFAMKDRPGFVERDILAMIEELNKE